MTEKEYAMIVAQNLRRIAFEHNKSQKDIADGLGIHKSTVSAWMNGTRTPKMDKIDMLCRFFVVNRSDIMEPYSPKKKSNKAQAIRIPVLGDVAAGIPIEAVTDILDYEEIPAKWASLGDFFALRVRGDSMEPKMSEGDVLIVRCQSDADSGNIVVAQVNGNLAACKRLYKHANGISLVSLNPAYQPMVFTNDEIEKLPVKILGRVVECRQKW